MKVHKIYFGLPRLNEEALLLNFASFLTDGVSVENYFCFWPSAKFEDLRETVLAKSDDHFRYTRYLEQHFPTQRFHDLSGEVFLAEVQLSNYLQFFDFSVSYPEENRFRPERFKISLTASCSQTILRAFAVHSVFKNFKVADDDVFIVTRPDVALNKPLPILKLNGYLGERTVLVPNSGHHAGGMPDTMIIATSKVIQILNQFPLYFLDALRNNQELKYEYLMKSLFKREKIEILAFDRICFIRRNGVYKHSGIDGIVPSDILI